MDAGPSTRQSSRNRVKSQRALESEVTNRILSAAKAQHDESDVTEAGAPASKRAKGPPKAKGTRKGGKKSKDVKVEDEVFCVCRKPSGDEDGPMIECEECNDWFHFECVGLDESTAADILTYVCPPCQSKTGKAVGYGDDVVASDVEDDEKPSTSGKRTPSRSRSPQSTSSGGASDAQPHSDSDDGSDVPPARKRTRLASTAKPPLTARAKSYVATRASPEAAKLPPSARKTSVGALPPARKFVVDRLATVVKGLFEAMDDVAASAYAAEVEKAVFEGFKETKDGKDVAGGRYKAQFNLLSSSLPKARPDLRSSIITGDLGAAQVANLSSEDLASAERLEEIQAARRAALEQTVKVKSDQEPAAIRLGRDGFEKAEDMHEKELRTLQEQELAARRRESLKVEEAGQTAADVVAEEMATDSPKVDSHETPLRPAAAPSPVVRRSVSIDVPATPRVDSPTAPVFKPSLTSAWSGAGTVEEPEDVQISFEEYGQQELDLSDIIPEEKDEAEEAFTNEVEAAEPEPQSNGYEALPIVWHGGIVNPAAPSPHVPPMRVKLICTRPDPTNIPWSLLLPHDPIAITGRVPTKNSLQFLNDSRLSPGKELLTVSFELDPKANEEERKTWVEMVEYHIGKDRHAIYLPYGNHPPPNAVKELYLIPLRPEDPSPDVTDLIDGYCLPTKREQAVWLGIFVANKQTTTTPPLPPATTSVPPVAAPPAVPSSIGAPAGPATFQNAQLQALMASLNPGALAAVSSPNPGGASPGVPLYPTPPIPTSLMGPPPPPGPSMVRPPYDGGTSYQPFVPPPPPPPRDMGYRSPHDQYGRPPPPPPRPRDTYDGPRHFDEPRRDFGAGRGRGGLGPRGRGPRLGGDGPRSPERGHPRQSDSGWASRGRGR